MDWQGTHSKKKEGVSMGCMHTNTVKMGEARCCLDCGYTIAPNRLPFFDKALVNYNTKKERKKANAKKSRRVP